MVVMTCLTLLAATTAVYTGQRWHASIRQAKSITQNIAVQRIRSQTMQNRTVQPTPQPVKTLLLNYDNFRYVMAVRRQTDN